MHWWWKTIENHLCELCPKEKASNILLLQKKWSSFSSINHPNRSPEERPCWQNFLWVDSVGRCVFKHFDPDIFLTQLAGIDFFGHFYPLIGPNVPRQAKSGWGSISASSGRSMTCSSWKIQSLRFVAFIW